MKKSFVFLLFISLILVLMIGSVSAENQTDILNDTGTVKSFDSIQSSINKENDGGTVYIDGSYKNTGKEITVSKSLTFKGRNNAVLDGNGENIFYAPEPVTMTFENITFINSQDYAIGTNGMYGGNEIYVKNCTFKNNNNLAIEANDDELTIENCIFRDNYQAIQSWSNGLTIKDSNFIKNSYCAIQSQDATIINSNFTYNGNKKDGIGAIFGNVLSISKSQFINNMAYQHGGAIYGHYQGCLSFDESVFMYNSAELLGGAIYGYESDISVSNCEFFANSAYNGAAIYTEANLNVDSSRFISNHADFSTVFNDGISEFRNSTFTDNSKYAIIVNIADIVNCNNVTKKIYHWVSLDNNLTESDFIKIVFNKIDSTEYKSGKKLTIKLINTKDNSVIKNCSVKVLLKGEKKTYTKYLTTDSRGIASFDVSKYRVDYYTMSISINDSNLDLISVDEVDHVLIYNQFTTVKAPKVKFKYKKSKYFKVTVKGKKSKKKIANLKLKLKVYTGKKYKIYKIKTNKKGIAKFNTKKLKRGKHKVVITSSNDNFHVYKKSQIRIK